MFTMGSLVQCCGKTRSQQGKEVKARSRSSSLSCKLALTGTHADLCPGTGTREWRRGLAVWPRGVYNAYNQARLADPAIDHRPFPAGTPPTALLALRILGWLFGIRYLAGPNEP